MLLSILWWLFLLFLYVCKFVLFMFLEKNNFNSIQYHRENPNGGAGEEWYQLLSNTLPYELNKIWSKSKKKSLNFYLIPVLSSELAIVFYWGVAGLAESILFDYSISEICVLDAVEFADQKGQSDQLAFHVLPICLWITHIWPISRLLQLLFKMDFFRMWS